MSTATAALFLVVTVHMASTGLLVALADADLRGGSREDDQPGRPEDGALEQERESLPDEGHHCLPGQDGRHLPVVGAALSQQAARIRI